MSQPARARARAPRPDGGGAPRFFCGVYYLEPGQGQKPHRHEGADEVYLALEGEVVVRVGEESVLLPAGRRLLRCVIDRDGKRSLTA